MRYQKPRAKAKTPTIDKVALTLAIFTFCLVSAKLYYTLAVAK